MKRPCDRWTVVHARQQGLGWLRASKGPHSDGANYTRALVEQGRRAGRALLDATSNCDGAFLAAAEQLVEQWLDTLPHDDAELHEYKAQMISDGYVPVMRLMAETDWVDDHVYWRIDAGVDRLWGTHD